MQRSVILGCTALLAIGGPTCKCARDVPTSATSVEADASRPFGAAPPGARPFDAALLTKLETKWIARPSGYAPRTRHLRPDGSPMYTNRLFLESSPYLLQHAHNPVNWYPWGDEAFETAKKLGRPVLLSIGYSTCHWCHVMEEESFEDEEIARTMNEGYVAIKVDREERPDVDAIYMSAVQALTGSGGWPMTTWLTPERAPFFGGTYFPARDGERGAQRGFLTILKALKDQYDTSRDGVAQSAAELAARIRAQLSAGTASTELPGDAILGAAAKQYASDFDGTYGGVGRGTKFPSSLPIRFLLRHSRRSGDAQSLSMATLTLERMASGGIYDQVGGGFHRYSTDARWLVPHFEKMLYDNALSTMDYLEGFQMTGRDDFARVARETLHYVERDMTSPDGAVYSATDADSAAPSGRREEGRFFTWTPTELRAVLGEERARVLGAYWGVTERGNFDGRSILHVASPTAPPPFIDEARELLYAERAKRPAPLRDEKILTAWNGLVISACARGALVLGEPAYLARAERAATFVLSKLRAGGRLRRSFKDGEVRYDGYLEDYAFLCAGLIDLFEASGNVSWLEEAVLLDEVLEAHYEDPSGGFFLTSDDHEALLAREKPAYDGAEPSGNSVHAMNLLRLAELTSRDRYRQRGERVLRAFGQTLTRAPRALSEMLLALDFRADTPKEIVIVTPHAKSEAEPFLAQLRKQFLPNRVLVVVTEGEDQAAKVKLVPMVAGKIARNGKTTAYVCERGACDLPTRDPEVFARQLKKASPAR
jgi:uncharacterized protein YyaL (SSP411 family)